MNSRKDLQATHQIIQLLEFSKNQSECDLDSLPGIYTVIDSEGQILKGNRGLGDVFGVNHEMVLARNLSSLFDQTQWEAFKTKMDQVACGEVVEQGSQIDIKDSHGAVHHYLWNIGLVGQRPEHAPSLFSIVGKDVTKLLHESKIRSRMEGELNTAKLIQDTLFPDPSGTFGESSVAGFYEVASECGGDWWYYTQVAGKVYLWVGDVTGHGVPAALVTSAARSAVSVIEGSDLGPANALRILSRAVFDTAKGQRVMTGLVASVDLKTGECLIASASHEAGILIPGGEIAGIKDFVDLSFGPTPPLGLKRDVVYQDKKITLKPGDRLVFFTDGIYEIQDRDGKLWSRQNINRTFLPFVQANRGAIDLTDSVRKSINDWRNGAALNDDVTFVAFKF